MQAPGRALSSISALLILALLILAWCQQASLRMVWSGTNVGMPGRSRHVCWMVVTAGSHASITPVSCPWTGCSSAAERNLWITMAVWPRPCQRRPDEAPDHASQEDRRVAPARECRETVDIRHDEGKPA
jgi:hypothetical protein